jgi:GNAT superfamily N-acetyltransferase
MSDQSLTLRIAGTGDLADVMVLLNAAAAWLAERDIHQWPAGGFPDDRIVPHLAAGTVYLVKTSTGEPVATVTLDTNADPDFWTAADDPANALYVHKLATSRTSSVRGVGSRLLSWACAQAHDAGRRWLRLDCAKKNTALQAYYSAHGFQHVRTVDLPHRASGALFQKQATTTAYPFVGKPRLTPELRDGEVGGGSSQREVMTLPRV